MIRSLLAMLVGCSVFGSDLLAHDTWVQANTNVVRTGDAVHLDLMLGNHGNEHRDFKLAGKFPIEKCTFDVHGPEGKSFDLKDRAIDTGYAPNEGFWSAKFVAARSGLYTVSHTVQSQHRTTRTIKGARTTFVASPKLDDVSTIQPGFDRVFGHPLEIVPEVNPCVPSGPGVPIKVKLLYKGKPLADSAISFIPRGEVLKEEHDPKYDLKTDAEGRAKFTPKTGNWYLIVAHRTEPEEKGEGYDKTTYSATLTVYVPEFCPCCD